MGVTDCGSKPGTSSTDPIVKSDIFKKWEDAGGQCPKGYKNPICSTGCRSEKSNWNIFDTGECIKLYIQQILSYIFNTSRRNFA